MISSIVIVKNPRQIFLGMDVSTSKTFEVSEKELDHWIHLEYDLPLSHVIPIGITTHHISNMDVKDVQLTVLP